MKIAFLTLYSGIVNRGVETFVKEVGGRLAENHEVTVFQTGPCLGNEKYKTRQIELEISWDNKDATGTIRRKFFIDYWSRLIFKFAIKCLPFLWKEKFDIIIPTDGGWEKPIYWLLRLFIGTKILVSGQSGIGYDDRWNLLWRPDIFIALTSGAERWARKIARHVKIVKIPNGVDLEKFSPSIKALKVDLPKPIILCASALIPSKRIDLTIKAASRIKNASLLVVGDGDQKDYLSKLGRELLANRFLLIKAKYEDMPSIYRSADLFTMVSISSEAFGIVYTEAMACGLPVVATDNEARREIIKEAGVFVEPSDIEKYAEALGKAMATDWKDKPRRQAEKFSWDKIAKEYEKAMKAK